MNAQLGLRPARASTSSQDWRRAALGPGASAEAEIDDAIAEATAAIKSWRAAAIGGRE
jgi:hypothetical protein